MQPYEDTSPSEKSILDLATDAHQNQRNSDNQITDRMISTDLEPIPFQFCPSPETKTPAAPRTRTSAFLEEASTPTTALPVTMVRIPCRARGVCETHTPQNAYFEIPENCPHGKLVVCSHQLCRESERRFRYCKVCDQVTAKRNFTKRHAHGIVKTIIPSPADVSELDSSKFNSSKKRKLSVDVEGESSFASLFVNDTVSGGDGISNSSDSVPSTVFARRGSAESSGTVLMMITRRDAEVLELVRRRPSESDKEATDQWIKSMLEATKNTTGEASLGGDGGEEAMLRPKARTQSLDKFKLFTDSFDHLDML